MKLLRIIINHLPDVRCKSSSPLVREVIPSCDSEFRDNGHCEHKRSNLRTIVTQDCHGNLWFPRNDDIVSLLAKGKAISGYIEKDYNIASSLKLFAMTIFITATLLTIPSCKGSKLNDFLIKSWVLELTPPNGPPEYQQGWLDGCKTGLAENNDNIVARLTYGFDKDPDLQDYSQMYRSSYRDAYIYCALHSGSTKGYAAYKAVNSSFSLRPKAAIGSRKDTLLSSSPEGPPNFRYGWRQGCQTGKAATGANYHKVYYSFVKDYRFFGDLEYDKGWDTAFWYCQRYYEIYNDSGTRNSAL